MNVFKSCLLSMSRASFAARASLLLPIASCCSSIRTPSTIAGVYVGSCEAMFSNSLDWLASVSSAFVSMNACFMIR